MNIILKIVLIFQIIGQYLCYQRHSIANNDIINNNKLQDQENSLICEIVYASKENESIISFTIEDCVQQIQKQENLEKLVIYQDQQDKVVLEQNERSLESLGNELQNQQNLKEIVIKLNDNKKATITNKQLKFLVYGIFQIKSLEVLDLDFSNQNQLQGNFYFDGELFNDNQEMENLKVLKLNFIKTEILSIYFDGEFTQKTRNLQVFDFSMSEFYDSYYDDFLYFKENSMQNWGNLKELNLFFQGYMDTSNYKQFEFISQFNFLVNLEIFSVKFDNFFIKIDVDKQLLEQIKSFTNLKELEIIISGNYFITDLSYLEQIGNMKYLEKLVISDLVKPKCEEQNLDNIQYLQNLKYFSIFNVQNTPYVNDGEIFLCMSPLIQKMENIEDLQINMIFRGEYEDLSYKGVENMFTDKKKLRNLNFKVKSQQGLISNYNKIKQEEELIGGIQKLENLENLEIDFYMSQNFMENLLLKNKNLKNLKINVFINIFQNLQNDSFKDLLKNLSNLENLDIFVEIFKNDTDEEDGEIYFTGSLLQQGISQMLDVIGENLKIFNFKTQLTVYNLKDSNFLLFWNKILKNLKNVENLELTFKFYVDKNLEKLQTTSDVMQDVGVFENLKNFKINLNNLKLGDIKFMKNLGGKMPNLKELYIDLNNTKLEKCKEFENAFFGMKQLEKLEINLQENKFLEIDYLIDAFQDLENLKYLQIYFNYQIKETKRVEEFSYSFRNLKKLEVFKLLGYNFKEQTNNIIKNMYDSVSYFQYEDQQNNNEYYNLKNLKEQGKKLIFNKDYQPKIKKCEDFDSPCEDCTQVQGQCKVCLDFKKAEDCKSCQKGFYQVEIRENSGFLCESCILKFENCLECNEKKCNVCEKGLSFDKKQKKCLESDNNTNIVFIIIGIVFGVLFVIAGIVFGVWKYKKKNKKTNSLLNQDIETDGQSLQGLE